MKENAIVALCGTFDVANFGDLLFPIVAADRLQQYGYRLAPVSPTAGATVFADALPPRPLADLLRGALDADAVLIGGGEIIHGWSGDFLDEYRAAGQGLLGYLSLWYGASLAGALLDVPIAWNTPGVPVPFAREGRRAVVDPVVAAADYVSVRDDTSRIFLGRARSATVVPDSVAGIASVWPKALLEPHYQAWMEKAGGATDARLMAVHLRLERIDPAHVAGLGAAISAFAMAHDLTPVLVAIGPSLNDGAGAQALSAAMDVEHLMLDRPDSLKQMAAVLAHARLYVGNSMHGYVTSAAYDVPGVIVARSGFRKYQGFAGHIGRPDDVTKSWDRALDRAAALVGEAQGTLIPTHVHEALNVHWDAIARAVADRESGRDRRAALLRAVLSGGLRRDGLDWIARTLPKVM